MSRIRRFFLSAPVINKGHKKIYFIIINIIKKQHTKITNFT